MKWTQRKTCGVGDTNIKVRVRAWVGVGVKFRVMVVVDDRAGDDE